MILVKETQEVFGYAPQSLSHGSRKLVVVACDYCDNKIEKQYRDSLKNKDIVAKDACLNCRQKKKEEICLLKYGVKNNAQRPDVQKKLSNFKWNKTLKQKCLQLYQEGYSSSYIAELINVNRYHVEKFLQEKGLSNKDEGRERWKKTMEDKYGLDYGQKLSQNLQEYAQEVYGVDNVFQAKEIKEKSRATSLKKYGVAHHLQDPVRAKKHQEKVLATKIKKGLVQTHRGKTISRLAQEQGFSRSRFHVLVQQFGFEQAMQMTPQQSSLELLLSNWLKEEEINYEKQVKIENKYADFRINNVIVELDGLYWHSEQIVAKNYHQEKRQLYLEKGYQPLFFREDELYQKLPIVKSIIKNKLGHNNKVIYARKCELGTAKKEFFATNHLMGSGAGKIWALLYEGEPVAGMQIKHLGENNYEISRFCTALNTTVVGGFSRLLKFVERSLKMRSLKTFIDLRYGQGEYLGGFGFVGGKPHLSFRWTKGIESHHRMKFPGNSGYDNGYSKIWDCGQLPLLKSY